MPESSSSPQEPRDNLIAAVALLSFLLYMTVEVVIRRPSFAAPDELAALGMVQLALEGGDLFFRAMTGSFTRAFQYLATLLLGPGVAADAPVLIAICAETILLALLARRWFGPRVAIGAVLMNLVSAFTLFRGRGLLSANLLPFELLAMLALTVFANRNRFASMAIGLAWGLLLFEYETWTLAVMVGFLVLHLGQVNKVKPGWPVLVGFLTGLVFVLYLSRHSLQAWYEYRLIEMLDVRSSQNTMTWFHRLSDFFFGGSGLPTTGPRGYPSLPPWSWPLLVTGLRAAWKSHRWLLWWVLIGMLPVLAPTPALETHRTVVAWPAWCLLAGLGWVSLQNLLGNKNISKFVLPALVLLGVLMEVRVYEKQMDQVYPQHYSEGQRFSHGMDGLKKEGVSEFITNVGSRNQSHLRLMLKPEYFSEKGDTWAYVPWKYLPVAREKGGEWIMVYNESRTQASYLWKPPLKELAALRKVNDLTLGLYGRYSPYDRQKRAAAVNQLLADPAMKDAWARTNLWAILALDLADMGKLSDQVADQMDKEIFVSAEPYYDAALSVSRYDRTLARRLFARAKAIDSRISLPAPMAKWLGLDV